MTAEELVEKVARALCLRDACMDMDDPAMTANNGWPGAPGVPENPERDGWHWLVGVTGTPAALEWRFSVVGPPRRGWYLHRAQHGVVLAEEMALWTYLGPCLLPADVAAREAAAWCAGRDAAAADADCGCDERAAVLAAQTKVERHRACLREPCCALEAASIRDLAPPADLSSALAAREAAAKAEGMREANAAVVDAHAAAAKRCSEEGDVIYRIRAEFLANSYAIQSAADDVRVTPIPEDKQP